MQQWRRGGFSPPASGAKAIGLGKPAPTLLLELIFKRHQSRASLTWSLRDPEDRSFQLQNATP